MATPKNQSVIKAFAVLKSFHCPDEWLTSCAISRRANLPEASGYRLIQTLVEIGALVRGPRGRYRPGMLLVSLSHNVAIADVLRETSDSIMAALARRLNVTLHMGIWEGGMVTYVAKVITPGSFAVHTSSGSQLEAYCSALGKVLLAALPEDQLEDFILDGDLVALTPYTTTEPLVLRAQLEKVREHGYAVDDREIRVDLRCVAVPVYDGEGRTVAAMSASDDAEKMTPERQSELRDALMQAAAALGRKILPAVQPARSRRPDKARLTDAAAMALPQAHNSELPGG